VIQITKIYEGKDPKIHRAKNGSFLHVMEGWHESEERDGGRTPTLEGRAFKEQALSDKSLHHKHITRQAIISLLLRNTDTR